MLLKKLFGFNPKIHSVKTEILAGITTFLTMAYILAVNPDIFKAIEGMPNGAVFTATGIAAITGTLLMSLYAKLPFATAPGMGLNAFFVYTVCLSMGYSWQFALTAILIEGFLFLLMTITNIRSLIVDAIPTSIKHAIGVGIGLFIAALGLKNAGIIVANEATLITLGDITQSAPLVALIGILITGVLTIYNVKGGILIGILATTLIGIPFGLTHFDGVLSSPPSIEPIFMQFEWQNIFTLDMIAVIFTFLFFDMFDTIGTIIGVMGNAGMLKKDGDTREVNKAFMADAVATVVGACVGTSTTTTFVESGAGVAQGGRTGLTSFTTACCFAIALFFAPLFLAIPSVATAPALFIVGLFMAKVVGEINFTDYRESLPAFLTLVLMPLSGSISDGILLGIIFYTLLNAFSGKIKRLSPTLWVLTAIFIAAYIFI